MSHESAPPAQEQKLTWNINVIWAIVAFVLGALFAAGMWSGRSSGAIDNLTIQVSKMQSSVDSLQSSFNNSNLDVHERLVGLEAKASSMQAQLDALRTQHR